MYPVIKPDIGLRELIAALVPKPNAIQDFEEAFAKKIGSRYAIAFPYGRSGLYTILKALNVKNKKVITPAYTCIVVQNAVVQSGNTPAFVDMEKDFNMGAEFRVTKNTAAIIPTYMYGNWMDIDKVKKKAGKALVIEDACLALLNKHRGKNLGTIGDLGFFSFNISKQMTTFDGGMVITDNEKYYNKIKVYRDKNFKYPSLGKRLRVMISFLSSYLIYNRFAYGVLQTLRDLIPSFAESTKMESWDLTKTDLPDDFNEGLTRMQAKIGLIQLKKLEENIEKRKQIIKWYNKYLPSLSQTIKKSTHSHYAILVDNRDEFRSKLRKKGVNTGWAMEYSVPHTPAYSKYKSNCPKSLKISRQVVNLPLYIKLKEKDIKIISEKIRSCLR